MSDNPDRTKQPGCLKILGNTILGISMALFWMTLMVQALITEERLWRLENKTGIGHEGAFPWQPNRPPFTESK